MKGRKLRSGVNWQGAFKQKGVKEVGRKQGLRVYIYRYIYMYIHVE
jgi:hypothetical protein